MRSLQQGCRSRKSTSLGFAGQSRFVFLELVGQRTQVLVPAVPERSDATGNALAPAVFGRVSRHGQARVCACRE